MKNADEPAFGFTDNRSSDYVDNAVYYGLTKREYFAAMAMQGILAGANHYPEVNTFDHTARITAQLAVQQADELLKQLEQ